MVCKFLVFDFMVLIFGFQYVLVGQQVCHRSQEESFKAVKFVKTTGSTRTLTVHQEFSTTLFNKNKNKKTTSEM